MTDEPDRLAKPIQTITAKNFVQRLGNKVAAFANRFFAPAFAPALAIA